MDNLHPTVHTYGLFSLALRCLKRCKGDVFAAVNGPNLDDAGFEAASKLLSHEVSRAPILKFIHSHMATETLHALNVFRRFLGFKSILDILGKR